MSFLQFWVAYTKCKSQHLDSTQKAFEQIDIIYRIIQQYPETFELVTSAQGLNGCGLSYVAFCGNFFMILKKSKMRFRAVR